MNVILGLNWGHDGSAAIVRDGRLVSAVSLERLSRKKKDSGISRELLQYVFDHAGVTSSDVTTIAFASFVPSPSNPVRVFRTTGEEVTSTVFDLFGGKLGTELVAELDGRRIQAYLISHHIAHAAAAFFTSPFERAACLSVDASMLRPEACSVVAYGERESLRYIRCPGVMIGNAYSIFTEKLGLGPGLTKAGTMMGLAPYGQPNQVALERWREFGASYYGRDFQENDLIYINYMWSQISGEPPHVQYTEQQSDSPKAQEIAASMQFVFENTLLECAKRVFEDTRNFADGNLCLGGGSFLNSETNMRIKKESGFSNLHLFPGCGDDGTSVGSALFVAHHLGGLPRAHYRAEELMYLGRTYPTPQEIAECPVATPAEVARRVAAGEVVGICQGGSEFGPRALGNRSLIADPRQAEMRDRINFKVKRREWFRPFAPAVLAEKAHEWFDINGESPFMLLIAKVTRPLEIPAVSHVDGTARLQTVTRESNQFFYDTILEFETITGVPVLLNTSMNVNGEPLVETPQDALRLFGEGTIDALVINDRLVTR
jgi:carbamoyltransferase